jgi:mannose-6-phosphate isomerase-like protein (cupin superfamily)
VSGLDLEERIRMATQGEDPVRNAIFSGQPNRFFGLDEGDWSEVVYDPTREGGSSYPQSVTHEVDLERYFERGMWTKFYDTGAFNALHLRLGPGFTIPRHHHNCDQLVIVLEGELRQGSRSLNAGDGYMTPAGRSYTVTAGRGGARYVEIRTQPMTEFQTVWDEADPTRWKHDDL